MIQPPIASWIHEFPNDMTTANRLPSCCQGQPISKADAPRIYAIYSEHGYLLDRFDDLTQAITCMERWPQAAFITCGDELMISKRPH